jgi:hypothetical protein
MLQKRTITVEITLVAHAVDAEAMGEELVACGKGLLKQADWTGDVVGKLSVSGRITKFLSRR